MSLPYGFMSASGNHIIVDTEKTNIVKAIFQQYLSGMSLGGIADFLFECGILSQKGKEHWTQPVLSNLLSNQKYIGYIISFDDFICSISARFLSSKVCPYISKVVDGLACPRISETVIISIAFCKALVAKVCMVAWILMLLR